MSRNLKYNQSQWNLEHIEDPFNLFKVSGVFSDLEYVQQLRQCIEQFPFKRSSNDLFSFSQTYDLYNHKETNIKVLQPLKNFLRFLDQMRDFFSKHFSVSLLETISVSASAYDNGDFLLCHDDKLETRAVAFVYYLNDDWKEEYGGALDLFASDGKGYPVSVTRKIYPECNSLVFFKVGNNTHHQVCEVTGPKRRLTINGWFHSDEIVQEDLPPLELNLELRSIVPLSNSATLWDVASSILLEEDIQEALIDAFNSDGALTVDDFIKEDVHDSVLIEIKNSCSWTKVGPPGQREYYTATNIDSLPFVGKLKEVFSSDAMVNLLHSITVSTKGAPIISYKKVHTELQKWTENCYSTMSMTFAEHKDSSLDLFLFFDVNENTFLQDMCENMSGFIYYTPHLSTVANRIIVPRSGALSIIKREMNEKWFCSYISRKYPRTFYSLHVSYFH